MAQVGLSKSGILKTHAQVFAISNEDPAAQKQMRDRYKLKWITFLSDKTGDAAKLYAGRYTGSTVLRAATFVVGGDASIAFAYINPNDRVRPAPSDLIAVAQSIERKLHPAKTEQSEPEGVPPP
ncbi:MAG: redoxin domain-containing protein [Armatimonadetes bacterium]|nr:redoxin domain-containing protein [Armatimonadota bacterium]MDE2207102.1 redoxin domain-containing protein [Armatimonadota bacterium]